MTYCSTSQAVNVMLNNDACMSETQGYNAVTTDRDLLPNNRHRRTRPLCIWWCHYC